MDSVESNVCVCVCVCACAIVYTIGSLTAFGQAVKGVELMHVFVLQRNLTEGFVPTQQSKEKKKKLLLE